MKRSGVETEIFINECSLQGQFQTIEQFENAVRQFMSIFTSIKQKNTLNTCLYKSEIFMDFKAIRNSPFQTSMNQIKDKSLKTAFTGVIFNKSNPIDWRKQRLHHTEDVYVLAETQQEVTNTSVAEVAERQSQKTESSYLLVNFSGSCFQKTHPTFPLCRLIPVIKKQTSSNIELECLDNQNAFEQWVRDKLDIRHFLERNSERFTKDKDIVQGQSVYIENKTSNVWYLDNLHKNHFEVFNSKGEHLGEANLLGEINADAKDNRKKYKNK